MLVQKSVPKPRLQANISMRLADFILANTEPILREWEAFARSIWPGEEASPRTLRDHAGEMIQAVARDMNAPTPESSKKLSPADAHKEKTSQRIDIASDLHAISRVKSGFDLQDLVSEYRALRVNVVELWLQSGLEPHEIDLRDVIRFNEAMDQLLAESVLSYVRRVDQSREIFLAILGHDLRNPLNAVTIQAEMLGQSANLDTESLKIAARISRSAKAMGRMIGDLLDFTGSQLGTGISVTPAAMNMDSLCKEVLSEMQAIHPDRTFIYKSDGNTEGEWDELRLRQLISNLIGNAVQHGSQSSPVTITIGSTPAMVNIAVCNHGAPIAPEIMPLIFEPLKRDPIPESTRPPGSIGLGLYISREVATAHRGTIEVHSSSQETVFTVKLPRHGN